MARAEALAFSPSNLTAKGSATNGTATATLAAPGPGFRNYITGIIVSANSTPVAAVTATLVSGATIDLDFAIPAATFAAFIIPFTRPLECPENTAAVLTLPALGAAITGRVGIVGFKASV